MSTARSNRRHEGLEIGQTTFEDVPDHVEVDVVVTVDQDVAEAHHPGQTVEQRRVDPTGLREQREHLAMRSRLASRLSDTMCEATSSDAWMAICRGVLH